MPPFPDESRERTAAYGTSVVNWGRFATRLQLLGWHRVSEIDALHEHAQRLVKPRSRREDSHIGGSGREVRRLRRDAGDEMSVAPVMPMLWEQRHPFRFRVWLSKERGRSHASEVRATRAGLNRLGLGGLVGVRLSCDQTPQQMYSVDARFVRRLNNTAAGRRRPCLDPHQAPIEINERRPRGTR